MAESVQSTGGGLGRAGETVRRFLLRPEPAALAATIILFIVFSFLSPLFATQLTFVSLGSVAAELGIVAVGMTLLLIGGHFDLSVGSTLGVTAFVVVHLMNEMGFSPWLAMPIALAFASLLGFINGVIVVKARINAFIVTLGTMFVYRGMLIAWTGGFPITVDIPSEFRAVLVGPIDALGGFRMSVVWFLAIVVAATFLLIRTRLGNWIQATGQNPSAARNLGVPVDRVTVLLFTLTGLLAGFAGVVQVARFASVDALRGELVEFQAIAVSVIGGTLLSGGYGSVIGTALGALAFAMIQIGLVLASAPGYFYRTLTGLIIVAAVILNTSVTKRIASYKPLSGLRRQEIVGDGKDAAEPQRPAAQTVAPIPESSGIPGKAVADAAPVLEATHISKHFGATTALIDVSLRATEGRILALLGDNGAGKSTLIKILSGVYEPDGGELRFRGAPVRLASPGDARRLGIATCFQDLAVCELLSVTRNVVLGREPLKGAGPFKWLDIDSADEITRTALRRLGVRWERGLEERGINLSGGERQSLAIARAMFFGSSCLILDEPTSALAVRQAGKVLDHIVSARDAGQAVILITHNFRHALSVADDIVVLAQGRVIGTYLREEVTVEMMTDVVASVA